MPYGPWGQFRPPDVNWDMIGPMILGLVLLLLAFALVMTILGIIIRYTSFGALVGMVAEVEETEHTGFRSGLKTGWNRFLRLFVVDLLIGIGVVVIVGALVLAGILAALLVGGVIAFLSESGRSPALGILLGVALGIIAVVVLIVVVVALSAITTLVREYAFRDCVLNKRGIFESLGTGFKLLRQKARQSLLMWLLMVGINLALGIILIPFTLLGVFMMVGPAVAVWGVTESAPAAILTAMPFLLVLIVVSIVLSGVYLTFQSTVWTLTFRELHSRELAPIAA